MLSVQFVNQGLQLLSSSADGLIRLWTIRTGECENTFDRHNDKIWAITIAPETSKTTTSNTTVSNEEDEVVVDEEEHAHTVAASTNTNTTASTSTTAERTGVFYTGGSDSLILRWRDVSQAEAENRLRLVEEEMLVEQQLQNDLYHKRYGKVCIHYYCVYDIV